MREKEKQRDVPPREKKIQKAQWNKKIDRNC